MSFQYVFMYFALALFALLFLLRGGDELDFVEKGNT